MVQITGKYQHEKNENIDEYFKAVGVPYIGRKMMAASSPTLEISESENTWTIKTISLFRTLEVQFNPGKEYDEEMPGGTLKTVTTVEDDKIVSKSTAEDGTAISRVYSFDDTHCIVTLTHEKSGQTAKRYFKRI